jgi:hypothetical protein
MQVPVNHWFLIRVSMLGILGVGAFWNWQEGKSGFDWQSCWIVATACTISVFIGLTVLHKTRRAVFTSWTKPSWFENPFQARIQTLQFWHAVAFNFMAAGLGGMLGALSKGRHVQLPEPCLYALIGLGIWVSMRIWVLIFLRKGNDKGSHMKSEVKTELPYSEKPLPR